MKPRPRPPIDRKTSNWGGPVVTVVLVLSPLWMMVAFLVANFVWVKCVWWQLAAIASFPYLVLGVGAGLMCLWTRPRRGPLLMIIPAACLAILDARNINGIVAELKRSAAQPPSNDVSVEQVVGMNYVVSGMLFGILALVWTTVVVMKSRSRWPRMAPEGLCLKCNYDRAGIGTDAVCPECGSAAP